MIGKILIVDDVSSNRIVFKVKLTAAGYQTLGAADGEGALRLALGERPDIILLNLSLGLEVLAGLKSHPQTRRIPLIVVADPAAAPLRAQALEGGAEDFLTRPIDDSLLQARLRAVLRMRQALAGMGEGAGQDLGVLGLAGLTGFWFEGAGALGALGALSLWNHPMPQLARWGRWGWAGFLGLPFLIHGLWP